MNGSKNRAQIALDRAKKALKAGQRAEARRWAQLAAKYAPNQEECWLILAAISQSKASIGYIHRALEINPNSEQAKRGLEWVLKREKDSGITQAVPISRPQNTEIKSNVSHPRRKNSFNPWLWVAIPMVITLILFSILSVAFISIGLPMLPITENTKSSPTSTIEQIPPTITSPSPTALLPASPTVNIPSPSIPPSPTIPTATPPLLPPSTPTSISTPLPTNTAIAAIKTQKKAKHKKNPVVIKAVKPASRPKGIGTDERWIDVDLSSQRVFAMIGDSQVKEFIVSTGTWLHPTVTGEFNIYVKYKYANMSGPGYFLPNVPNVMYFYKGYGIHGTYWHNNFGTPMSHGCINLETKDSSWMFDFASTGTTVNIHP